MPAAVAKSLARLSSGLYVVSAAHNNARSAMVASWVSQASFEPLGLTVAVAKDRAIESMMQVRGGGGAAGEAAGGGDGGSAGQRRWPEQGAGPGAPASPCPAPCCGAPSPRAARRPPPLPQVGDVFVLNVLGEEGYGPIMKHFLKRFAPGGRGVGGGGGWGWRAGWGWGCSS